MNKIFRGSLHAASFIAVCAFFVGFFSQPVSAETNISGSITNDQEWRAEGNPYVVTGATTVFPDVTLTIKEGVQVQVSPNITFGIRGMLDIQGTENNRVTLTGVLKDGVVQPWKGLWIETTLGGAIKMSNATLSYAGEGIKISCCHLGGPLQVSDSTFSNNAVAITGYAGNVRMRIDRALFENNKIAVTAADKDIYDSVFRKNDYGLQQTERINVTSSRFEENTVALSGGRGDVKYSTIVNNDTGIKNAWEGFRVSYSFIKGNREGIILSDYDLQASVLNNNNILDNTDFNVKNPSRANMDLKSNWWGTTELASIREKIVDGYDNPAYGLVLIEPVLENEVATTQPVEVPEEPTPPAPEEPKKVEEPATPPTVPPTTPAVNPSPSDEKKTTVEPEKKSESKVSAPAPKKTKEIKPASKSKVKVQKNQKKAKKGKVIRVKPKRVSSTMTSVVVKK